MSVTEERPKVRAADQQNAVVQKADYESKLERLANEYRRVRQAIEDVDVNRLHAEDELKEIEAKFDQAKTDLASMVMRLEVLRDEQVKIEGRQAETQQSLDAIQPFLPTRQQAKPPDVDDQVLEIVERFGSMTAKDVAATLKIKAATATAALKRLAADGKVNDTGIKVLGSAMFEWVGAAEVEQEVVAEVKRDVRDFVVAQKQPFSPKAVTDETKLEGRELVEALQSMLAQGIIAYVGFDDLELYEYVPPTGPGKAALKDMQRRQSETVAASNGSDPIAGTGSKWKVTNPDVRATVGMVEKAGGNVRPMPSGHYEVSAPGTKKTIMIAGTPSSRRSVLNDRARIRRDLDLAI